MRVIVYDEVGGVALDYDTRSDSVSLCPGRLEKAQVVGLCRRRRSSSWTRQHRHPRAAPFDSMFTRGTRGSNQSGLAVPIFLFEPLHGRCIGVLDLEPVGRPTGPV